MSDQDVKDWYSRPPGCPTAPAAKVFDWSLLEEDDVIDADVLDEGPGIKCLDEMLWAPYARSWAIIDFTPVVLDCCRQLLRCVGIAARLDLGDFRALPYGASVFDLVLDFSSSDHVEEDRRRCRSEAFRVLRSGGLYVVTYADRRFYDMRETRGKFGYEVHLRPDEMREELQSASFVIEKETHLLGGQRSGIVGRKP